MPDAPLPAHAVGPDRAEWSQRIRSIQTRRWRLSARDSDLIEDLFARLIIHGCRAAITPEERVRVERIEREVSNA